MPSSFQLFNTELARIAPGYLFDASGGQNHQHDPQVSGITHEVQEYFQKGYTKLVEECVFMWQRGQAQQPQGQGQGRHGGANL